MITFVGSLQDHARPVQPSDGNRELGDVLAARVEQVESAQLTSSLEPVANGVRMNEQLTSGPPPRPAAGDERRHRVEQVVVALGERPVDLVDQLATGLVVAAQRTLDEERV